MWKNIVEQGRPQMAVWWMGIAGWMVKATNAHSDRIYNTYCLYTAKQLLHDRDSMLRYTYMAWSCSIFNIEYFPAINIVSVSTDIHKKRSPHFGV